MTKTMKAYYAKAYPKINITLKIGEKIGIFIHYNRVFA